MLKAGVPLSENQELQYNTSLIAVGVWEQVTPRFFEENILLILAANMKLLCYKNTKASINLLLQNLYKKPYILQILLNSKHCKNINLVKKLLACNLLLVK